MHLFQRLFDMIRDRFQRKPVPDNYSLDVNTLHSLEEIAEREQRSTDEIASLLLNHAIRQGKVQDNAWLLWQSLTPREQEVLALICLRYTNRQIAAKLDISPETVKTHVEHILKKSRALDRNALRLMFIDWDFNQWDG